MRAASYSAPAEIQELAGQFGPPATVSETLRVKLLFGALEERPARVAEVVPVIRRSNGKVLTITKANYPPSAFRLPSGGIRRSEPILDALLRESYEETGLRVVVQRFLAIVRYQILVANGRMGRFTSYIFLVNGEGPIEPIDEQEHITEFREVDPAELPAMATHLASLPADPDNDWSDWGRFRSVVHRVAGDLLAGEQTLPAGDAGQ